MKQYIHVIEDVSLKGLRKHATVSGAATGRYMLWSDSSADLRLGLDVVELADTQWADTVQFTSEATPGQ